MYFGETSFLPNFFVNQCHTGFIMLNIQAVLSFPKVGLVQLEEEKAP